MLNVKLWSHNPASAGSMQISKAITRHGNDDINRNRSVRSMKLKRGTTYRYNPNHFIINYGNTTRDRTPFRGMGNIPNNKLINPYDRVGVMSNKILAFNYMANQPHHLVPSTLSREAAQRWVDEGFDVVVRHKTAGHSGDGIQIITRNNPDTPVPNAPLYTKYINKRREWRVHVIRVGNNSYRYLVQQKKRNYDVTDPNWVVRNYENGFIYATEDIHEYSERLLSVARAGLGDLDFGAIDILETNNSEYNRRAGFGAGAYVYLETNTAPGVSADSVKEFYGTNLTALIRNRAGV